MRFRTIHLLHAMSLFAIWILLARWLYGLIQASLAAKGIADPAPVLSLILSVGLPFVLLLIACFFTEEAWDAYLKRKHRDTAWTNYL